MHPSVRDIDAALEAMRSQDPRAAQNAEAALEALTAGQGFDGVTQYALQDFLWSTLPKKFLAPSDTQIDIANALGRLMQLAGLPRYAAVCRSETTRDCIEAWRKDEGPAVYRRAQKASGVEPPHTEELSWGTYFGLQESAALHGAAAALEMAILAGDLKPASPRWTKAQKEITQTWLTTPDAAFEEKTPLQAVHAERMEAWLRGPSDARRSLLGGLAPLLHDPVPLPEHAERALDPLHWFLTAARPGIPLTQKHNLGLEFVHEAAKRWDWWNFRHRLTTELEVPHLYQLHHLSRRMKLVRRQGRRLVLTPAGRRALEDVEALWRAVARGLIAGEEFELSAAELLFALLIAERQMKVDEIKARIAPMLAEQGWATRDETGRHVPLDELGAARAIAPVEATAVPLGIMVEAGDWRDRSLVLTGFGRATALEGLRARARGPRHSII